MACCSAVIQPLLDNVAYRFPVSVKGVLLDRDHVVLVGNSRGEWELPGGKLEPGETPEACVAREIVEELALRVLVGPLLDAWVYEIHDDVRVLVLAYGCTAPALPERLESPEGRPVGRFTAAALDGIPLPAGYRRAVGAWLAAGGSGR
jgi:8-oxo-dGTP pyrophosphatase MutT (NUDIX family)